MKHGVSRSGDGHVTGQGATGRVLDLPDQVLVGVVQPEEQLLLGALRDLRAIGRLVARVRLKVAVGLDPEVGSERRAEQDAEVDALRGGIGLGVLEHLLDHAEIGALGPAHVDVPLVLLQITKDRGLRRCHRTAPLSLSTGWVVRRRPFAEPDTLGH